MRKILLSLAGAALIAFGAIQPTRAATVGNIGTWNVARADCNIGFGWRDLYAPIPTVYAANRTPGAGNDKQAVYYWVRAVDARTGATGPWTYGGGVWANDNQAAVFPRAGVFGGHAYFAKWHLTVPSQLIQLEYSLAWYSTTNVFIGSSGGTLTNYGYQNWLAGTNQTNGLGYAC